jgi:alkyldihydroxyacetonephosphate synthase
MGDLTALLAGLRGDVGDDHVATNAPDRDAYGRDLWPRSLLDSLVGDPPTLPDAVVWPADAAQVAAVVRRCAAARVPIVPFGAGSGVCGGARPTHGGVVVDLKRLKRIRRLDGAAGVIEVEAGLIGELLERRLEAEGLTLGHFPSSILCSSVGGWLAGRSAGQCSSRYGKIEDMVVDLEVVTGDGRLRRTPPTGSPGAGPDWNQLFVGSEGTLGLITAATLRVHPQPAVRRFRGWMMPTVDAGFEVMRRTMQEGLRPAVMRLYDPLDTMMVGKGEPEDGGGRHLGRLKDALAERGPALRRKATASALLVPGLLNRIVDALPERSLLVTMAEGDEAEAAATDDAMARFARQAGGRDLGEAPGRRWFAHRYDVSYKQSRIYMNGGFVDTMEVSTTWARLPGLYRAVCEAVAPHVVIMAHFSHAYAGGCNIYFSFAGGGRTPQEMRERYDAVWRAGQEAVLAQGACIAHHHGVGLSRLPYMDRTHGEGRRWFEALKPVLDPAGILNPGKVFAEGRP